METNFRCEECDRDFNSEESLAMHNSDKHPKQEKFKVSKKTIFLIIGILAVVAAGYFFMYGGSLTGNATNMNNLPNEVIDNNIQKITLGFTDNYSPDTIKVKSGVPVEITLDSSVRGCFRSFNIKDLGVSYRSSSPSDTIKFTPNKKGSFRFQCSMAMGTGTIIVE